VRQKTIYGIRGITINGNIVPGFQLDANSESGFSEPLQGALLPSLRVLAGEWGGGRRGGRREEGEGRKEEGGGRGRGKK
jgi:hypothetical protein